MRLNHLVNGLVGTYIALAPLNANALTAPMPTTYAKGTPQYELLESVANDAFSQGKVTSYITSYTTMSGDTIGREATLHTLTLTAPKDTMRVEVYDWDKNNVLSVGDEVRMGGRLRPSQSLKENNPWYVLASEDSFTPGEGDTTPIRFMIFPSKAAEREMSMTLDLLSKHGESDQNGSTHYGSGLRGYHLDPNDQIWSANGEVSRQMANTTYLDSEAQLARLRQIRNNRTPNVNDHTPLRRPCPPIVRDD